MIKKTRSLVDDDPWLAPYSDVIDFRVSNFKYYYDKYLSDSFFSDQYKFLGIHFDQDKNCWVYREWAPNADALFLIGDFNKWNRESHPLIKSKDGVWSIKLEGINALKEGSFVKVVVHSKNGVHDRIPAYIQRVVQHPETFDYAAQITIPTETKRVEFVPLNEPPIIYEAHIGIAQEKKAIGSFVEFTQNILPRIHKLGYNTIQLMAIQEHPYYGSFGYHVSNFFAVSSRFGTIQEFKSLINEAHKLGIRVIIDLVHSHAVKNIAEGLNLFDGTEYQYFHQGQKGNHNDWDSKLFDYGKQEVIQFLLSNIKFWLKEFNIDGFRFDGITSMLYHHHGDNVQFNHYDKYFYDGVDNDALLYLQLANKLIHEINPNAISIAEDYSGMPGLCRDQEIGGVGFDYRLGMGIPDFWIKYLKEKKDEEWNLNEIYQTLLNRRYKEKTIAYSESHDQAIVGDKSIAFWLMDKEMYFDMGVNDENHIIDRGIALHKMIRFLTICLGGEAYLNFIGNEFGHPEWIDFPREGNNWSYQYARRQWSLVDDLDLRYKYLALFDKEMIRFVKQFKVLEIKEVQLLNVDDLNQVLIFKKADLVFVFNLSPTNSVFNYQFYVPENGCYQLLFTSDDKCFGGYERVDKEINYTAFENKLSIYCVNRAVQVFKRGK